MTSVAALEETQLAARAEHPDARSEAMVRLLTCGSVDDGKSTLIGRLLSETNSVPLDTLEYARRTRRGRPA